MTDVAPAPQPTRTRRRIGELLLDERLIGGAQLQRALSEAQIVNGKKERLGQTVVRLGFASEQDVARALAGQLHLDPDPPTDRNPDPDDGVNPADDHRSTTAPDDDDRSLPATGGGATVGLGLLLMAGGLILRRRSRLQE